MGFKRRRSGPEAQELILDAAEDMVTRRGPDGLRLTELARSVGLSHPAILHHFGSRAGLIRAVVERAIDRLETQLLTRLAAGVADEEADNVLEMTFNSLGPDHARMMAWLMLSADDDVDAIGVGSHARRIAEAVHAIRVQRHPQPFDDTLNVILLAGLAVFGDAVAGDALRQSAGVAAGSRHDFLSWLAALLRGHLDGTRPGSA